LEGVEGLVVASDAVEEASEDEEGAGADAGVEFAAGEGGLEEFDPDLGLLEGDAW
jgi:hypothetical protein